MTGFGLVFHAPSPVPPTNLPQRTTCTAAFRTPASCVSYRSLAGLGPLACRWGHQRQRASRSGARARAVCGTREGAHCSCRATRATYVLAYLVINSQPSDTHRTDSVKDSVTSEEPRDTRTTLESNKTTASLSRGYNVMLMRRAPRVPDQQQQPTRLPCLTSQLHADTRDTELAVARLSCVPTRNRLLDATYGDGVSAEWQSEPHRSLIWDLRISAIQHTHDVQAVT